MRSRGRFCARILLCGGAGRGRLEKVGGGERAWGYADQLTFLDKKTRTRRDHQKYLTLIDAIALLHQHQRPVKTIDAPRGTCANGGTGTIEYIEVAPSDIALANRLAHEVLGRSIDELPPQTRAVQASNWTRIASAAPCAATSKRAASTDKAAAICSATPWRP